MSGWANLIREASRHGDGRFGEHPHSAPEVTIADAQSALDETEARTMGEWEQLAVEENARLAAKDALYADGHTTKRVTGESLRSREIARRIAERRDALTSG